MLYPACRIGLTVVLLGWLLSPAATAQDKPRPVQDDAKLFSDKAIEEATAIIAKIKDKTGRDLVVETKEKGPADLETGGKQAADRAELLASKSDLDGVYLLITSQPRKFHVQRMNKGPGSLTQPESNALAKILSSNLGKDRDAALIKFAEHTFEIFKERPRSVKVEPKVVDPPKVVLRTVKDEAGIFGKEARDEVNATVAKIKEQHQKDLFIETVEEGPEKEKASAWARERFNDSGLDGVYIVIAKKPGFYRIVVGKKTLTKLFTQNDIGEMEKILNKKESGDKKITQAATFVLETMNKVNESALKEIKYLRGDWVGPMVDVQINKDGKTAKENLLLRFGAIGGEPVVTFGVASALKNYRIQLEDDGKLRLTLRGADAGKDLVLTYEISETTLEISAPRPIAVERVRGKVDLTGDWKRPTKKE